MFSYRGLQFQVLLLSFSFQVDAVSRLGGEFCSFACQCPVFLAPFIEETIPLPLCILGSFAKGYQLYLVYFSTLDSVPLVYASVFMQVPYCFDYHSFVTSFEIRICDASSFDCFGYSKSFVAPYKF